MQENRHKQFWPPCLVALGAFLWATDSLFRSQVIRSYSPLLIVFVSHCLALLIAIPLGLREWLRAREVSARDIAALAYLGAGSSGVGMIVYTQAFAISSNVTVPVLIQKMQPLIAIALARLFLGERIISFVWPWIAAALFGTYLLSFGFTNAFASLSTGNEVGMFLAMLAAAIWATGTVAGRALVGRHTFLFVTCGRYFFGALTLAILVGISHGWMPAWQAFTSDWDNFLFMSFIPGFLALVIYYFGLRGTPAWLASLCELSFPLGAILVNWVFLGASLTWFQLVGAAILIGSVNWLGWRQGRKPAALSHDGSS